MVVSLISGPAKEPETVLQRTEELQRGTRAGDCTAEHDGRHRAAGREDQRVARRGPRPPSIVEGVFHAANVREGGLGQTSGECSIGHF